MTRQPYASARRVFWVVDNGASHRGWTAAARLTDAFPNATMIHLPVHASWLNQIEIYFSVVQRKLLTPDDFPDLDVLANQLTAFEARYNTAARPFDWRFNPAPNPADPPHTAARPPHADPDDAATRLNFARNCIRCIIRQPSRTLWQRRSGSSPRSAKAVGLSRDTPLELR